MSFTAFLPGCLSKLLVASHLILNHKLFKLSLCHSLQLVYVSYEIKARRDNCDHLDHLLFFQQDEGTQKV